MSCSRAQHGDPCGDRTQDLLIQSPTLYHNSVALPTFIMKKGNLTKKKKKKKKKTRLDILVTFLYELFKQMPLKRAQQHAYQQCSSYFSG